MGISNSLKDFQSLNLGNHLLANLRQARNFSKRNY